MEKHFKVENTKKEKRKQKILDIRILCFLNSNIVFFCLRTKERTQIN